MEIEVKNLNKSYGKKQVLSNTCLSAKGGECIGILGSNGSGKSTLLNILAGVLKPDKGEFLYNTKDLFKYPRQRRKLVGLVPQGTPLLEELTARDNLSLWYNKKEMKSSLKDGILKTLGIDEFLKLTVSKMSGGMKKRLSIACAVASRPPILLLDEPMSALDLACKQKIYDYIKNHKMNGGIAVLVTHDALELELCDRFYILKGSCLSPYTFDGNIENLVKSF